MHLAIGPRRTKMTLTFYEFSAIFCAGAGQMGMKHWPSCDDVFLTFHSSSCLVKVFEGHFGPATPTIASYCCCSVLSTPSLRHRPTYWFETVIWNLVLQILPVPFSCLPIADILAIFRCNDHLVSTILCRFFAALLSTVVQNGETIVWVGENMQKIAAASFHTPIFGVQTYTHQFKILKMSKRGNQLRIVLFRMRRFGRKVYNWSFGKRIPATYHKQQLAS